MCNYYYIIDIENGPRTVLVAIRYIQHSIDRDVSIVICKREYRYYNNLDYSEGLLLRSGSLTTMIN